MNHRDIVSQCNLDNLILCQLDDQPQHSGDTYVCPNGSVLASRSNEKCFISFLSVDTHAILVGKHGDSSPRQLSASTQENVSYIDNSWAVLKIRVAISLRLATTEASQLDNENNAPSSFDITPTILLSWRRWANDRWGAVSECPRTWPDMFKRCQQREIGKLILRKAVLEGGDRDW